MNNPAIENIAIELITVPGNRRAVDREAVKLLASSIQKIGLKTPITIRSNSDDMAILVAGAHRLEAVKSLGWEEVPCFVFDCSEDEAELWEIAENLHRAELTVLQRAEQIGKWVEVANRVSAQVGQKRGRPESGDSKAARELGVERKQVQRAVKVSKLTPEAKEAARARGLDDNQSALIAAAAVSPERQTEAIHNFADAKARAAVERANVPALKDWSDAEAEQKRRVMVAWNACSPAVKDWFRDQIDAPIMDARLA